jgi:predicted hydrocarbon binding protein
VGEIMTEDSRYEVENEQIKALLKELGSNIGKNMPKGWGFNLLIFQYGGPGSLFYLSSANRSDMIRMMKEFISHEEGKG